MKVFFDITPVEVSTKSHNWLFLFRDFTKKAGEIGTRSENEGRAIVEYFKTAFIVLDDKMATQQEQKTYLPRIVIPLFLFKNYVIINMKDCESFKDYAKSILIDYADGFQDWAEMFHTFIQLWPNDEKSIASILKKMHELGNLKNWIETSYTFNKPLLRPYRDIAEKRISELMKVKQSESA